MKPVNELKPLSFFSPGPPSAPVSVISSVNGTSVNLEWDRPLDTGGRSDLQYSVLCQKCSGDGGLCEDCASFPGGASGGKAGGGASIGAGGGGIVERSGTAAVRFVPRQTGLTESWVTVLNLVAHTNYSFRILAMNAVTHLSNEPSPYALVNITTNQAGRVQNNDIQILIMKALVHGTMGTQAFSTMERFHIRHSEPVAVALEHSISDGCKWMHFIQRQKQNKNENRLQIIIIKIITYK